ncbi:M61 family metallopeptidase [Pleomorphovibrio marinus]|uniref:M61 family metallopeptidase n=1 Tax=Pleomorphovibrio marinus TaxID=2164132 RepID=UPI000E0BFD5F|nr:M61 family metallopeptidase [Pleomorphovibrio marinus]
MIECVIKTPVPSSQLISIQLSADFKEGETCNLQLASWRPGRYFMAHYAQFIRDFRVEINGHRVPHHKLTKESWAFTPEESGRYTISYNYYAAQMDAGGSWLDPEQLYINFINLLFAIKGREQDPIMVRLVVPPTYKVATALKATEEPFVFIAGNYQHLVDSPLIASDSLQHFTYQTCGCNFHLWFQGSLQMDVGELLETFKAFTERQIEDFGDFPAEDYHFLFQLLPYRHYHGVEHKYSTVITLGPAEQINNREFQEALVGVSSHELYHFWNVCRIRPQEILPYDFSKEAYMESGWLLEGITSYMGDLYLLKTGYFTLERYLEKFHKMMDREFNSCAWKHQSIAESSFDLWLDGYQPGIPDKKVSIYNRGALLAFCLDIALMQAGSSLSRFMKKLWESYGKANLGYEMQEVQELLQVYLGSSLNCDSFHKDFIFGRKDIYPLLLQSLEMLGIECHKKPKKDLLEGQYGISANAKGEIGKLHQESEAYQSLMLGDRINSFKILQDRIQIVANRRGKSILCELKKSAKSYYHDFELLVSHSATIREKWMK